MGLFSGLEKMGLGNLEEMEVFDEEKKKEVEEEDVMSAEVKKPTASEEDFLFTKAHPCPVCEQEFQTKMVRTSKLKLISSDTDLRPRYTIDSLKYDAWLCPNCGYASLSRFFKFMLPAQAKDIKEKISATFKGIDTDGATYSYDDAIMRHQMSLANAVVKKAKTSEKAYTCLKMAWLFRGKQEELLAEDEKKNAEEVRALKKQEMELLKKACEGFKAAFSAEEFPMCGMDEITVMYLIAELCRRTGLLEESGRWISRVLTTRGVSERIKNRTRDIKELLEEDKKRIENAKKQ
ncbi:MAG: DUF2225 domain-containing protein [Lachnospiraceae bacterium]|nr:DUF2225 domain-containing protein [Lachnospiraceae bacterium]